MTRVQIQKIQDDIADLQKADINNCTQHQEILQEIKKISDRLDPLVITYQSAGKMWKWVMAFLVLISILIGIISNWARFMKIFK